MTTPISSTALLGAVPKQLREPLLACFDQIVRNYRERRWEPSELNGGKFCECAFSVISGYLDGAYASRPSKPSKFADACRALENRPSGSIVGDRSIRILIPRVLVSLYEIRNNRGVGHVGGDVNPNHSDATFVVYCAKWVLAELVRVFHGMDLPQAAAIVESLTDRVSPVVWRVGDKRRVLNANLSMKDKALVLLYDAGEVVAESDLITWLEHSNASVFRRDIIRTAHKNRLIEYDAAGRTAFLSPLGVDYVEKSGLI